MYDWVTLLYCRNWYNIVNQLYFKKKKKKDEDTIAQQPKLSYSPIHSHIQGDKFTGLASANLILVHIA